MVSESPWPLVLSFMGFSFVFLTLMSSHGALHVFFVAVPLMGCLLVLSLWWRDVVRESTFQGSHSHEVQDGLRIGMISFIMSEVMFFFSFFFGYFYLSLSPDVWIGSSWPPIGVQPIEWMAIPSINTLLLLSSGVSVTWSHHALLGGNLSQALTGLLVTVSLGVVFVFLQYREYYESGFCISDSSFGSIFYLSTGFHGIHVIIGSIMLAVCAVRMKSNHFTPSHHFGFEGSAWYWHFVDVVWLVLFLVMYWWGM